jgi:SAM-dependent methyltransferase
MSKEKTEGWSGWDEYAPFYDWENARTLGRKDLPFWQRILAQAEGRVLELGCGTGRLSLPLSRGGARLVGVDRSSSMLARLMSRARGPSGGGSRRETRRDTRRDTRHRAPLSRQPRTPGLVRADIRALPFVEGAFQTILAPYGMLQSLIFERDLQATLSSVAHALQPGGLFGIDLVPDVPKWPEYRERVQLRGRTSSGRHLTLIESVRQDKRRRRTIFRQRYVERCGGTSTEHCFDLTFRTLPVPQITRRLERLGFEIEAVLGDYRGRPWDQRADVWIVLARKRQQVPGPVPGAVW